MKAASPVKVEIHNVGALGVNRDIPPHELPPEVWSNAQNMRFRDKNAERIAGHSRIFGTPEVVPGFVFNVPGVGTQSFFIYMDLAKAYVIDAGVHTEITNVGGDYTTSEYREWGGTLLAGIPIFNNGVDVPQWWPALSSGQELEDLPNWDASIRAKILRAFGSYVFALNITDTGINFPHQVIVSHKADPGSVPSSWNYADAAVDAILFELTDSKGGEILDGLALSSMFYIYKKHSIHACRFIGGDEVWARDKMVDSGILTTRCVCLIKDGTMHFIVSQDDIVAYAGGREVSSIVEAKNRKSIFAEIDPTNFVNSFVFENKSKNEAWFCYPTIGQEIPNKVFFWNYVTGAQGFRTFSGVSVDSGLIPDVSLDDWDDSGSWDSDITPWENAGPEALVLADPAAELLFKLDDGLAFGASSSTLAFLERTGLAVVGKDRQGQPKVDFGVRKMVLRLWPKITGTALVSVQVGGQEFRDGDITWSSPQTFNPQTQDYVDFDPPVNGRLIAVRFETSGNVAWQIEGYDLRMALLGEFGREAA